MARRDTARHQLRRLLYLLPAAAREEGAAYGELAESLGISEERVAADLREASDRIFYHPTGGADDLQITLEPERVRVRTTGEFRRPPRLTVREALALGIGLRARAARAEGEERERFLGLARRLERRLASRKALPDLEALLPRWAVREEDASGEGLRTLLVDAARERRRCRIDYLKPGAETPEERILEPYAVAHGSGRWYAVGRDPEAGGGGSVGGADATGGAAGGSRSPTDAVRVFRLDRILEAVVTPETFERADGFRPDAYVAEGTVYRADEEETVVVRYSPRIARWILEREEGTGRPDGSAVVERRAAEPGWAVRHALRYGADAEVVEPPEVRGMVREAADRVAGMHGARAHGA